VKYAIAFLISLSVLPAQASDRTEKVKALMEAQGLAALFEGQKKAGEEAGMKQAEEMASKMLEGLSPPEEIKIKFKEAMLQFIESLKSPFSGSQIVEKWAELYGARFSEDELDQLLVFYTSPLAQKEVMVTREALPQLAAGLQGAYKPILDEAVTTYVARLKKIIEECNCRK
jgi:hypothetical protein